jgi:triosephosphate isomerase
MKYIIANWKNHKNIDEAGVWMDTFIAQEGILRYAQDDVKKLQIIICVPYPFLHLVKSKIADKNLSEIIKVGAQDLSYFDEGAYTGEVGVKSLKGLVDYAIVGHSERRYYQEEITRILTAKVNHCKRNGIEPIFCVRDAGDIVVDGVNFLAYEPIGAIGTDHNEELEKVLEMKTFLKVGKNVKYIYGGSVKEENAKIYLENDNIDGILVGNESLSPEKFYGIATSLRSSQ